MDEARETGIDSIGNVPWGTHFCHFYRTREDLIDVLAPYFKAGLENGEFCLWVTSEPLGEREAREAMAKAMPDFARYLNKGQMEIMPHDKWYLKDGVFDSERVLRGWVDKLDGSLARSNSGMRVSSNTAWVDRKDRKRFMNYEDALNGVVGKHKMMVLCTYWLERCSAVDILETARSHSFAIVSHNGSLELVEGALYRRTREAEEALRVSEEKYRQLVDSAADGIAVIQDGEMVFANPRVIEVIGDSKAEQTSRPVTESIHPDDRQMVVERLLETVNGEGGSASCSFRVLDKEDRTRWVETSMVPFNWNERPAVLCFVTDVTERKLMEEALKASEERYRLLIENASEGVFVAQDGKVVFANPRFLEMKGFSAEELAAMPFMELVHPDDLQVAKERYRKQMKGGESPSKWVLRTIDKAGNTKWEESSTVPITWEGRPAVLGLVTDITERKMAEEGLEQHNRLLATTNALAIELASLPPREITEEFLVKRLAEMTGAAAVWFSDYDPSDRTLVLRHLEIEPEALEKITRLLGKQPNEVRAPVGEDMYSEVVSNVIGRRQTLTGVTFGAIPPSVSTAIQELLDVDHFIGIAYVIEGDLYGTSILAMKTGGPDPSHELLESVAYMVAISLRQRRAEDALRQSETHYRLLTENLSDVVWTMNTSLKYTYVSPTVTRLRGYSVEEAMAQSLEENLTPASLETAMRIMTEENAKEAGGQSEPNRSVTLEAEVSRKDGSTIWTEDRVSYLRDSAGQITGYLGVSRDVSERKKAEARQQRTQEQLALASRLASIGQLASGVAHEINNPLTVVIGCSQMLMEKDIPKEVKEDLELVHDGAQQVAGIVKGLLAFARQSQPGKSYVDINTIVSRVVGLRAYEMRTHDITVKTRLDPDLPWTMADEGQIQQVFLNIVVNAEQAIAEARDGGHLEIRTDRVGDSIRISFKDDGVGIAKEDVPKLFDPFFTTKEVGEGTGLGLSISYGIIQEHNGRIYARGKSGKGATFLVELPIVAETDQLEPPDEEPAEEPERKATGRVLVVDDEPAICQMLARLLTQDGHRVETAGNAHTALEKLKRKRFSLILVDIRMKDMSGIELYAHLGKTDQSLQRRVVFITGDTLARGTREFLNKTKAPYICKPFDVDRLRESISQMLTKG